MFLGACLVGGWIAFIFGNGYLMGRFDLVKWETDQKAVLVLSTVFGPVIFLIFAAMTFVSLGEHHREIAREQIRQKRIEEMNQQRILAEAGFDEG